MVQQKILFIGGLIPDDDEIVNNTKAFMQGAAQSFQLKIIEGLKQNGCDVDILSAPFIGSYPKNYKKFFFKYKNTKDNLKTEYISFNNIWGLRNFSRYNSIMRSLKRKDLSAYDFVIIYSVHTPFTKTAKWLQKRGVKTILISPDLPEYMNLNEKISIIYKLLKKIDILTLKKTTKYMDGFVLLTKHMSNAINLYKKPEVIIEGVCDKTPTYRKIEENIILYSGTLNKRFGIVDLIESFKLLPSSLNAKLYICGDGDSKSFVEQAANANKNIKYFGSLRLSQVKELQNKAFMFINPRKNNETYTKFSFPSKTMEYLSFGRPVVCYKLDGIPDEYDDVLFYIENERSDSFNEVIERVLNFTNTELEEYCKKVCDFVETKTPKATGKKILKLMREIEDANI